MAQTLRYLATLLTLAILLTIGLGFTSMFIPGPPRDKDTFIVHFACGLFTSVGILFVHSLIFIYFLGTGRWVKEVTIAYRMPDEPWHKQTRELKRATFPPALFSMLIGIAAAAAGAGAQLQAWPWYLHMMLGLLTLAINLWAFRIELRNVTTNAGIIADVMREVDRLRAAQGLVSNEEALQEEVADVDDSRSHGEEPKPERAATLMVVPTPIRLPISREVVAETIERLPKKPSLFLGALGGYLVTSPLGTVVCWYVSANSGDFDNQRMFTLLICFGAPGAFEGYRFAVRRRKRMGVNEPTDEWQQFVSSWTFMFLAAVVLVGSFVISLAESLLFDLVYGAPWLENLQR